MTNATQQQQQGLLGLATHPQNVLEEEEQLTAIVQRALEFVVSFIHKMFNSTLLIKPPNGFNPTSHTLSYELGKVKFFSAQYHLIWGGLKGTENQDPPLRMIELMNWDIVKKVLYRISLDII